VANCRMSDGLTGGEAHVSKGFLIPFLGFNVRFRSHEIERPSWGEALRETGRDGSVPRRPPLPVQREDGEQVVEDTGEIST